MENTDFIFPINAVAGLQGLIQVLSFPSLCVLGFGENEQIKFKFHSQNCAPECSHLLILGKSLVAFCVVMSSTVCSDRPLMLATYWQDTTMLLGSFLTWGTENTGHLFLFYLVYLFLNQHHLTQNFYRLELTCWSSPSEGESVSRQMCSSGICQISLSLCTTTLKLT